MRILMLGPHPNVRGPIPKHTPHLAAALRSLGCTVIMEGWGRHSDQESLTDKIVGRYKDIWHIRRVLHRETCDVLVVKTAHDWGTLSRDIPLLLATRGLCPHIVLQFHGSLANRLVSPGFQLFKLASSWLLKLSDAAMVLSSEEQRQWKSFYPSGKFYMVSNPFVSPVTDTSQVETYPWHPPPGVPILLFVGRLLTEKGVLDLLNAFARLREIIPSHLLIVGAGPLAEELQQQVTSLGLDDDVKSTGYLQGTELVTAYHAATIFVLPTFWGEGFPTVIAEAMAAGLPIITTPIRGAVDHLVEGVNTLFVPPHNPKVLADTLAKLLANPTLRTQMAQANREKVKEFAPEAVGQQYLQVLREIVSLS